MEPKVSTDTQTPVVSVNAINEYEPPIEPDNSTLEADQDTAGTSLNNGHDTSSESPNGNPEFIELDLQEGILKDIREFDQRIRDCLPKDEISDVDAALRALSDLDRLPITRDILRKDELQIVNTVGRLKNYMNCENLRKKAEDVFNKYKKINYDEESEDQEQ